MKLRMSKIAGVVSGLLLLTVSSAVADDCGEECHEEAMEICGSCEFVDAEWHEANEAWQDCHEDCGA